MHCLNQPSLTADFLLCSNLFVHATIVCTAGITSIMPLQWTLSQLEQAIPNRLFVWDRLLTPLKYGAQGSKILVTTCSESVASIMQTVPAHHLKN